MIFLCSSAMATDSSLAAFDEFWNIAKEKIHPKELAEIYFTKNTYSELRKTVTKAGSIYELTPVINEFLSTIPISHTQFYDSHSLDFYLFRSMFCTKEINTPEVNHIGAQFSLVNGIYVIRDVLNGYPAAIAGLRRGDRILKANKSNFHPYHAFNPVGKKIRLTVQRNNQLKYFIISAIRENPNLSMHRAIENSTRIYEQNGKRAGYVRLWSGTHKSNLVAFQKAVISLGETDGFVLDLRDGYGGAWYEYLDLFFSNRDNYFEFTITNRNGTERYAADQKNNQQHYAGPMVVLINEGTRSGKEALAYQFKKSGRAVLVGATTQGAFSAGEGQFNDIDKSFFLYLAVAEYQLDGKKIEGVGINPDIVVEHDLSISSSSDLQLDSAIKKMFSMIENPQKN